MWQYMAWYILGNSGWGNDTLPADALAPKVARALAGMALSV